MKNPVYDLSDIDECARLVLDSRGHKGRQQAHMALVVRKGRYTHGTEAFTPKASWTPGQKWSRYRTWLSSAIIENNVTEIAYEDVKRHVGVLAAHAYGGYLAMLEMVAGQHNVRLVPVGVGVIKKHWTGRGNALKDDMIREAKRRGFIPSSDNAADALAILHWAMKTEAAPVPKKARTISEVIEQTMMFPEWAR